MNHQNCFYSCYEGGWIPDDEIPRHHQRSNLSDRCGVECQRRLNSKLCYQICQNLIEVTNLIETLKKDF